MHREVGYQHTCTRSGRCGRSRPRRLLRQTSGPEWDQGCRAPFPGTVLFRRRYVPLALAQAVPVVLVVRSGARIVLPPGMPPWCESSSRSPRALPRRRPMGDTLLGTADAADAALGALPLLVSLDVTAEAGTGICWGEFFLAV